MTRLVLLVTLATAALLGCTDDAIDSGADPVPEAIGSRKLDVELVFEAGQVTVTLHNEPAAVVFDAMVHAATFSVDHSGSTMIVSASGVSCRSGSPAPLCTVHASHAGETGTGWFFYDFGEITAPRAIASALRVMPGALATASGASDPDDAFQVGRVRCTSVGQPSADAPDFCDILATK
jgi:hypothetical protein